MTSSLPISRPPSSALGDVSLPAGTLGRLADLCGEIGERGIEAAREAGRATGSHLVESLGEDGPVERLAAPVFWSELAAQLEARGFGRLTYRILSPGVGELRMEEGAESEGLPDRRRARPGCHFSTGLLAGVLTRAAGRAVAVMEVECRAGRGAGSCRFLVGSGTRLEGIRQRLEDGLPLERAVEAS